MRYLVVSDIHSNYEAFSSVIKDSRDEWEEILCLGDIIGYGPDPEGCIELLKSYPHNALAGNHDGLLSKRLAPSFFNPRALDALKRNETLLSPESLAFLEGLPPQKEHPQATLVHGSLTAPMTDYILNHSSIKTNFLLLKGKLLFFGHTHLPALYQLVQGEITGKQGVSGALWNLKEGRFLINPGSVGQPRDHDPRAAYGIWDSDSETWQFRRCPYPIDKTVEKMKDRGFPAFQYNRLLKGE